MVLVQTKLNEMLESLWGGGGEAEAIDICQPNLPLEDSILFCFWI